MLLFLAGFVIDFVWTLNVRAVAERRPAAAGLWSAVLVVLSSYALSAVLGSLANGCWQDLFCYALGTGLGTYAVVKRR